MPDTESVLWLLRMQRPETVSGGNRVSSVPALIVDNWPVVCFSEDASHGAAGFSTSIDNGDSGPHGATLWSVGVTHWKKGLLKVT